MKKILLMMLCLLGLPALASAGFVPDNSYHLSVADAKDLQDNMRVQLTGRITQSLGDEKYVFTDGTDTIVVEIDEYVWHGQNVSPKDTVTIDGEIEKEFMSTEIDVKRIDLVKEK